MTLHPFTCKHSTASHFPFPEYTTRFCSALCEGSSGRVFIFTQFFTHIDIDCGEFVSPRTSSGHLHNRLCCLSSQIHCTRPPIQRRMNRETSEATAETNTHVLLEVVSTSSLLQITASSTFRPDTRSTFPPLSWRESHEKFRSDRGLLGTANLLFSLLPSPQREVAPSCSKVLFSGEYGYTTPTLTTVYRDLFHWMSVVANR